MMYGKATLSLVVVVVLLISYNIFMGTVDFRSYFFPLIQSPAVARPLCATNPPLRVYMYDLPRRFNVGMLNRRNPDQTSVTAQTWPPWPKNTGLKRQHSVEYWMMGSLLYEGAVAEEMEAVRVSDPEMADVFFVPFFSSLSFNTHGHHMTDPATEVDHQLQIDLLKFLRQSKYWQLSGGRDHVIPMTHPNAFRFLREQVNGSIQIVVDFGRYPRVMSNLSKDVVAPYVHVVDSFKDDNTPDPFESRTTLLFFRGRTIRKDEGIIRVKLAKILAGYDDVHYERSVATGESIKASSQGMRLSKFCLHPAGDTPSSCRLFDAIVSHCVPVIVSDQIELPFEDDGRVSVDVFSRHYDPKLFVHGGRSFGCPENAGAAGTLYDAVLRSLIVSNHNISTYTETLLLEFPNQPLWTNVYVENNARATVPLLWSRVQVQGQISLFCGGVLSFGLAHYASSEFELLAEELLMSDSVIKVYGALRMSVKIFLMWKSKMLIDGGDDATLATSLLEASNLIVLKESSVIHSDANLGVHGQGLLNLSGPGDWIEAQRLVLSLFYSIHVGPGSVLRGPLENATTDAVTPRLHCENQDCPIELLQPPEDCNVNSSLSFTLQICRVEDISVEGLIKGSVVHFHRARTINVQSSGTISASGMGCTGGVGRGHVQSNGVGSGAGHGGKGGPGCYNGSCIEGGISYGNAELPCELGSGSGDDSSAGSTAGGGIIVMGSSEHPLSSLSIEGTVVADGESFQGTSGKADYAIADGSNEGPGGGSGGTILLFLHTLALDESAVLSSIGGTGCPFGGGGGGGGRIHFHWSDIPTGDVYQPIAAVKGSINARGGIGRDEGGIGENGTLTGKACPKGLYGIFCEECPVGTYKNVTGSDRALCHSCPDQELPHRAVYIAVRGGIAETPCPYICISDRYHMPHCYTALEELIYTFGGPWLFGLLLVGLLILLALVLSVARMRFCGVDELPGPAPTQHGSQIDHSFPFLESLNEVLETNRAEESRSHVHRMYFMGPNTFSEPWHLPHTPPEPIKEIVYEGAFNAFVDEINAIAAYQWWEGAIYSILSILAYPLAWSWQQWRRGLKLQRLREFVRSEYDHACLRSCRSRALYEGIKVAATSDLMLAYLDFFLGGDEKRTDLPARLHQRLPMSLPFGGDGSYMAPFLLHSDNILTSLMSQSIPPTSWYRLVAGLNAQLRLVRRGWIRATFRPVLRWLETHANPALRIHGIRVDLAWFQATACGYFQYGILVYAIEEENDPASIGNLGGAIQTEQQSRAKSTNRENPSTHLREDTRLNQAPRTTESLTRRRRTNGSILDANSLQVLEERKEIFYLLSFILFNTRPVGHQDLVGIVISMLLLGDFSLVLLTLLQLYSFSLGDVFLVLFVLPLGIILPFPAGINALFSHGPRRSAGLARVYALWNITSLINVMVAFLCGYVHYNTRPSPSRKQPNFQPWNISMDESEWWIFPAGLVLCKFFQLRLINWHVANLEIQDRSLYSNDFELFWHS